MHHSPPQTLQRNDAFAVHVCADSFMDLILFPLRKSHLGQGIPIFRRAEVSWLPECGDEAEEVLEM